MCLLVFDRDRLPQMREGGVALFVGKFWNHARILLQTKIGSQLDRTE